MLVALLQLHVVPLGRDRAEHRGQRLLELGRLGGRPGDERAADAVYRGMTPLGAEDVAECIRWAVAQPTHVNIDEIVVRPRDQATATEVHRRD